MDCIFVSKHKCTMPKTGWLSTVYCEMLCSVTYAFDAVSAMHGELVG